MKYNAALLLKEILNDSGLSHIMCDDVSNHSTITMNMKGDINPIHIRTEGDELWIWTTLCDYNLSSLSYNNANILPLMLEDNGDSFYCGQPCLYSIDGTLDLRAQIKHKHLESSGDFNDFLEHFYEITHKYRAVLI